MKSQFDICFHSHGESPHSRKSNFELENTNQMIPLLNQKKECSRGRNGFCRARNVRLHRIQNFRVCFSDEINLLDFKQRFVPLPKTVLFLSCCYSWQNFPRVCFQLCIVSLFFSTTNVTGSHIDTLRVPFCYTRIFTSKWKCFLVSFLHYFY